MRVCVYACVRVPYPYPPRSYPYPSLSQPTSCPPSKYIFPIQIFIYTKHPSPAVKFWTLNFLVSVNNVKANQAIFLASNKVPESGRTSARKEAGQWVVSSTVRRYRSLAFLGYLSHLILNPKCKSSSLLSITMEIPRNINGTARASHKVLIQGFECQLAFLLFSLFRTT